MKIFVYRWSWPDILTDKFCRAYKKRGFEVVRAFSGESGQEPIFKEEEYTDRLIKAVNPLVFHPLFDDDDYDLIQFHNPNSEIAALCYGFKIEYPMVFVMHDVLQSCNVRTVDAAGEGWAASFAEYVICVSEAQRQYVKTNYGVADERSRVIVNSPSEDFLGRKKKKLSETTGQIEAVYCGLVSSAGHRNISHSLRRIADDISLHVYPVSLNKLVTDYLKEHENITIHDLIPAQDICYELSQYDCGVIDIGAQEGLFDQLDLKEHFLPNKLFEYQAAGIPTVAPNTDTLRTYIQGTNCGAVFDYIQEAPDLIKKVTGMEVPPPDSYEKQVNEFIDSEPFLFTSEEKRQGMAMKPMKYFSHTGSSTTYRHNAITREVSIESVVSSLAIKWHYWSFGNMWR